MMLDCGEYAREKFHSLRPSMLEKGMELTALSSSCKAKPIHVCPLYVISP